MTKLEYHNCSRPRSQQPFPQMLRDLKSFHCHWHNQHLIRTWGVAAAHGQATVSLITQGVGQVQVNVGQMKNPYNKKYLVFLKLPMYIIEILPQSITLGVLLLYYRAREVQAGLSRDVHTPVVNLLPGAATWSHYCSAHLSSSDSRFSVHLKFQIRCIEKKLKWPSVNWFHLLPVDSLRARTLWLQTYYCNWQAWDCRFWANFFSTIWQDKWWWWKTFYIFSAKTTV